MPEQSHNLVIKTLAKGSMYELRSLIDECQDYDTARMIYTELKRLAHVIASKHGFPAECRDQRKQAA
jgi:hypothetical protein